MLYLWKWAKTLAGKELNVPFFTRRSSKPWRRTCCLWRRTSPRWTRGWRNSPNRGGEREKEEGVHSSPALILMPPFCFSAETERSHTTDAPKASAFRCCPSNTKSEFCSSDKTFHRDPHGLCFEGEETLCV